MFKTFPYRFSIRQHIDYNEWLDQRVPLRKDRVDHITLRDEDGFLRFICPCYTGGDVFLNIRFPNQDPYYTFFETVDGFLTINEKVHTRCGCSFWVKDGEIIDYQAQGTT